MQLTLKGFFFLLMFLFANHGQAQSSSQEYPNYLSGKQYFVKGEYRTARGFFDQVTKAGAIAPYALYYSAICSYHLGEKEVAKAVLGQIRQNYPEWKQLDEVLLWSGKIDLELELAEVAFLHFSRISSANIRQLATNIKQALVPGLSATTLSALNQAYPNDTLVARSLAAQLARQPLAVRNEALLKELRSRFSLSPAQLPQDLELKSQKKDEYHVAVFLPLFYRQQSPERTPKTIVSDFYNGLRMAWQDLNAATSQAKIHIHTYDTQRDSSLVARLMEKEEIKGMDLFIGPLLPETSLVAERYARLYQTNLINPLSDRPELFEGNPYGLKLVPSYMDQARAAAELVRTQRDHRYGMVFHGDNEKERLQAQEYARALELNNMEVVFMAEVNKHQGKFIFDTLTAERPKRYDENEGPRLVKAQKEEPVEKK
ncbi:MAG: hypothetical protein HC842_06545 [Cytophagales bacterium]|nr:hypothetical protein [Cytophagales bacterium]